MGVAVGLTVIGAAEGSEVGCADGLDVGSSVVSLIYAG